MQGAEAHVVNEGPGPISGFLQLIFLGLDLTPDFRLLIQSRCGFEAIGCPSRQAGPNPAQSSVT